MKYWLTQILSKDIRVSDQYLDTTNNQMVTDTRFNENEGHVQLPVVTKTRDGTGQHRDIPSRPGY